MTAAAFGSVCMEHQACRKILNLMLALERIQGLGFSVQCLVLKV